MRAFGAVIVVLIGWLGTQSVFGAPVQWAVESGGNGHFYEFIEFPGGQLDTWETANAAAQAQTYQGMIGYLATVGSPEENTFIASLLQNASHGEVAYLGGFGNDQGTNWQWITGELWTYSNWAFGEPNGNPFGLEERLTMYGGSCSRPLGTWNDVEADGSFAQGYIVELPEPATLSLLALGGLLIARKRRMG